MARLELCRAPSCHRPPGGGAKRKAAASPRPLRPRQPRPAERPSPPRRREVNERCKAGAVHGRAARLRPAVCGERHGGGGDVPQALGISESTFYLYALLPCTSTLWAGPCWPACVPVFGVVGLASAGLAPWPGWRIRTRGPRPLPGPRVAAVEHRFSLRRSDPMPRFPEVPEPWGAGSTQPRQTGSPRSAPGATQHLSVLVGHRRDGPVGPAALGQALHPLAAGVHHAGAGADHGPCATHEQDPEMLVAPPGYPAHDRPP